MLTATRHFFRLLNIARTLARHDALFPLDLLKASPALRRALKTFSVFSRRHQYSDKRPGERLSLALQSLGPTFIKLGQALATRPDLIGDDVAKDLTELQDRLPPFSGDDARRILEDELDAPVDRLFASFEEKPIAAASIAQVHRAVTTDGVPVAVKILRPDVEEAFRRDVATFTWLANLLEKRVPDSRRLRPIRVVETFADTIALEMDLRYEAAAASELGENTANDHGLRVPDVNWPRTAQRVLTTEWIDGIPMGDREALMAAGHDMRALASTLVQVFLLQIMRDGFFHADLHQGNLFVDGKGTIVAVDFGIMGRLDRKSRRYLAEILRGFTMGDYRRIAEIHFEAGYVPRSKNINLFAQALRAIGEPINGRPVEDISFGKLLAQLFQTTETFDMHTQPQLLLLQKTMVMVEGLALHLEPGINMWDVSPPVIDGWIEGNMGPDAVVREGAEAALSALRYLPLLAERLETSATELAEKGMRLHPDTARQIGAAQAREARRQTVLLGVIATLLALLAVLAG